MPWVHLESSTGLRILGPSSSPPPCLHEVAQLFAQPLSARAIHCFRKITDEYAEEVLILLHHQEGHGMLGDVTVAVGGSAVTEVELETLLNSVLATTVRTNEKGARMILDAICVTCSPSEVGFMQRHPIAHLTRDVVEYDGLEHGNGPRTDPVERRVTSWDAMDIIQQNCIVGCGANSYGVLCHHFFVQRKALLSFVLQDFVPLTLLYCNVSPQRSTSPISCVPSTSRKSLVQLMTLAQCSCRCLFTIITRTLSIAYNADEEACRKLWSPAGNSLPFIAFFSVSGLLCASPSFFSVTDHRDRLFVSALAVEQLVSRPNNAELSFTAPFSQLVHVREFFLRCQEDGVSVRVVLLSIGSAVCCALGFAAEVKTGDGQWDYQTFVRVVEQYLATTRTTINRHAQAREMDSHTEKGGESNPEAAVVAGEGAGDFTAHLLLCAEVTHPTPWFNDLLHEMNCVEAETLRDTLMTNRNATSRVAPSQPRGTCTCFPFTSCSSRKAGCQPFVWHSEAKDLPLDMMWCVAASHIVVAEAHMRRKCFDQGCHTFFSLRSNLGDGGNVANPKRYGLGWFQYGWRGALRGPISQQDTENKCGKWLPNLPCNYCNDVKGRVDCTKVLQGLVSIGGGPRPSVTCDAREIEECSLFRQNTQSKLRQADSTMPLFDSRATIFPIAVLQDEFCEAAGHTSFAEDREGGYDVMTAFYTIGRGVIKGTTRDALVQEVFLFEGDQIGRESEVTSLSQHRYRENSSSLAILHQAVSCIIEDVYRTATP
ncbi:unnamed protein product [Trypanosoma congolense IL3000]|uniref:WGS project CAEQ00000000 data, annotated contig 1597 n=1 Tax=Trypanosoma congolense (strain IL3000) TaxID=1068625 RepID=F9W7F0_TRYCI|nr:unnamed protein product [Trypanosoma congolense IL3000]